MSAYYIKKCAVCARGGGEFSLFSSSSHPNGAAEMEEEPDRAAKMWKLAVAGKPPHTSDRQRKRRS